uniref:hypothetical protein n=1 Tax=Azospirillum argentinense TaxID=2970906 RepID=UPI0010C02C1C|nr:hypothetical protein [Azospirillum argentinense]
MGDDVRVFAALLGIALSASTASLAAQPDWKVRTIELGDTVDQVKAKIDALNKTLPAGMNEGFVIANSSRLLPDGQEVLSGIVAVRNGMGNVREVIQVKIDPWTQKSYSIGRIAIFESAARIDTTNEYYQIRGTVDELVGRWGAHFVGHPKADGSGVRYWFYDGYSGEPLSGSVLESGKFEQRCRPNAKAPVIPPSASEVRELPFSDPATIDPACGRLASVEIQGSSSSPGYIKLMIVQTTDFVAMSEFWRNMRLVQDEVNKKYEQKVKRAPVPPQ